MSQRIRVETTRFGNNKIIVGDYQYWKKLESKTTTRWVCVHQRARKCVGTVTTDSDISRVISSVPHTCNNSSMIINTPRKMVEMKCDRQYTLEDTSPVNGRREHCEVVTVSKKSALWVNEGYPVIKSRRMRYYAPLLKLIFLTSGKTRKNILYHYSDTEEFMNCLCECAKNILVGNVSLMKSEKRKLKRSKHLMHEFESKKTSMKRKREIIQKGSFLTELLSPIVSLLGCIWSA
jgi:FLYWCH zinc finger domain